MTKTAEKARQINLASLSPERFEDLIEAVFDAKRVRSATKYLESADSNEFGVLEIDRSGRGHDEGVDLLVTTLMTDCVSTRQFKWLVQCKHKARGGRSVQASDFSKSFSFPDIIQQHRVDGYLLVCSTRPSTGLQRRFDSLKDDGKNQWVIWDEAKVCAEVNRYADILKQFFPDYYEWSQNLVDRDKVLKWAENYGVSKEGIAALDDVV